jgi:hypothetical protein
LQFGCVEVIAQIVTELSQKLHYLWPRNLDVRARP